MVAEKHPDVNRETLHKAIDELPDRELIELISFIDYLQFKYQRNGSPWAKEFYDLFAPIRETVSGSGMTEAEIDQLIDEELEEFRRERNP